ncbi:RTA1-domain-containing protein [Myriangium duriaei CBS 260.36]|uniref:RTA1-domain-containing protein n=1 Tax=Myriangium duriaei CBS 260.36 TaxID=1168546 RepID=A0A9P4IXI9_9PEZI|nr:RTA1-domain-containing protein [Myriangium duriaei CBS 260.36]
MSNSDSSTPTYVLWYYTPSIPVAAAAAAVFAVLGVAHLVRLVQKRCWFGIPLLVGSLFEVIGYGCRIWAHYNIERSLPYAMQSLLLLLAPILFAASVYMLLGRIIRAAHGDNFSLISTRWITKIFVCGDILCFMVQGGGGAVMSRAKSEKDIQNGEHIILGGLVLQIIIFVFFVITAVIWNKRMSAYAAGGSEVDGFNWQKSLTTLYATSVLITVRNIVRCAEFGAGNTGYLLTHEWTIFVFDALLMAIVLVISWTWYSFGVTVARTVSQDTEMNAITTKSSR